MRPIRTVEGDRILPNGPILAHEHLRIDLSETKGTQTVLGPAHEDDVIADLRQAAAVHGLVAVADLSVSCSGRDIAALKRIAQSSGVAVIAATGLYWDPISPGAEAASIERLRDAMIGEIEHGAEGLDARCGVIKVGTGAADPTPTERRIFIAAAQAARATGASVITHTSRPSQADWHVETLTNAGLAPERMLISHLHTMEDANALLAFLGRGTYVGFDQIGFAKGPGYDRIADLVALACEAVHAKQLILASDMARWARLTRHGGTSYATVFSEFLPRLAAHGLSADAIARLMGDNPRSLFGLVPPE